MHSRFEMDHKGKATFIMLECLQRNEKWPQSAGRLLFFPFRLCGTDFMEEAELRIISWFHSGYQSSLSQVMPYLIPHLVPSSAQAGFSLLRSLHPQFKTRLPTPLSFFYSVHQHPEELVRNRKLKDLSSGGGWSHRKSFFWWDSKVKSLVA